MSNTALEWAYWVNQSADLWWRTMGHAALQSGVVAVCGLALVSLCRRWSSPLRYGILLVVLTKFAIAPALLLFVPHVTSDLLTVEVPVGSASGVVATAPPEDVRPRRTVSSAATEPVVARDPVLPAPSSRRENPAWWDLISVKGWCLLGHVAGSLAVLLWLLRQGVRLGTWVVRVSHPASETVLGLTREIQAEMAYGRHVDVRVSGQAGSPMALQLWQPVIVLPRRTVETLSPEELRPVLAHEVAHLKRRDPLVNTLQILLLGIWWFHPAYWWLHRRLRTVREECCDDAALAHGTQPEDRYCQVLLDAARSCRAATAGQVVLGFGESRSTLGYRIARIMDPRVHKRARLGWLAALALIAVILVGMPMWRRSSSMDRPMPATESNYGPTALESLTAGLGLGEYPRLFMDSAEFATVKECLEQSRSIRSTHNGVTYFEGESTRDTLLDLRGRLAQPFYAEFLLAKWYEINQDPNEAARWMARALADAPVVLVRQYELLDGRPLANTPVGSLVMEYRVKTLTESNTYAELDYVNLTTDDKGRVYLPGYDTKIRCSGVEEPRGYDIETGRHGYLALHAHYSLLPTIYAWPRGLRRPAMTLPTSEFYDYRNAIAAQGLTHRVGLAELSIDRCYRMGPDGRVTITDGRKPLAMAQEAVPAFGNQAPALDQAMVHFNRSTLQSHEILQVRVFDHRSRGLLVEYHVPADYEYDGDSSILLRSLGAELPERVDVWFWVTEFPPDRSKQVLPAKVGSRADLEGYHVELRALHGGSTNCRTIPSTHGDRTVIFSEPNDLHAREMQAVFAIQARDRFNRDRYARVALMTKDGQRYFNDHVIYARNELAIYNFFIPLSDVDRFELFPIGQERCFYFDGVLLPERSGGPLDKMGVLELEVRTDGKSGSFTSDSMAPIYAKVTVLPGTGGMSFSNRATLQDPMAVLAGGRWEPSGTFTRTETHSTIVCELKGLNSRLLMAEILDLSGSRFGSGGTGRAGSTYYRTLAIPVSQIQGVRIRVSLENRQ